MNIRVTRVPVDGFYGHANEAIGKSKIRVFPRLAIHPSLVLSNSHFSRSSLNIWSNIDFQSGRIGEGPWEKMNNFSSISLHFYKQQIVLHMLSRPHRILP